MIIDFHSHLAYAPIYPEHFLSDMFIGLKENEKFKLSKILPIFLKDKNGLAFLKQMDIAGIDKSILLIVDGGVALGEAKLSIEEIYKVHFDVLKNNLDRFMVFAGIDPRRGKFGYDLFRKGIEEYKFGGLKLYPPMGFSTDFEGLLPYYEYCQQNKLPVLLHTGPSQENLKNELANPLFIKSIAEKYQEINFILAHAGFGLDTDLIKIIEDARNVYVDISGFQSKYPIFDEKMVNDLSPLFCNERINSKVLFGTDWPLFNLMTPVSKNIAMLNDVSNSIFDKCEKSLENIMYNNASKILATSNY